MQIINLTPHPVTVLDGPHEGTYPSAGIARVDGLPHGPIVGLPDPAEGVRYVVSVLVAEAVIVANGRRNDIFVPGDQVRDESGRIVGCRELIHPRNASPAAYELAVRHGDDRVLDAVRDACRRGDGHAAADALGRIFSYRDAHVACYVAGRAEGLTFAAERCRYIARHGGDLNEVADLCADAVADQLCSPLPFLAPATEEIDVVWREGGVTYSGHLRGRALSIRGLPLRPLYLSGDQRADLLASQPAALGAAGMQRGDVDLPGALLWCADLPEQTLTDRRRLLADKIAATSQKESDERAALIARVLGSE